MRAPWHPDYADCLPRAPLFAFDVRHLPSARLHQVAFGLEQSARQAARQGAQLLAGKLIDRAAALRQAVSP